MGAGPREARRPPASTPAPARGGAGDRTACGRDDVPSRRPLAWRQVRVPSPVPHPPGHDRGQQVDPRAPGRCSGTGGRVFRRGEVATAGDQVTVLSVVGAGRSGTTVLASILGEVPGCAGAGEIR